MEQGVRILDLPRSPSVPTTREKLDQQPRYTHGLNHGKLTKAPYANCRVCPDNTARTASTPNPTDLLPLQLIVHGRIGIPSWIIFEHVDQSVVVGSEGVRGGAIRPKGGL